MEEKNEEKTLTLRLPELETSVSKGVVTSNLDQLKVYLDGVKQQLADVKVTKDNLVKGRETRAILNKLQKQLNDRRIAIHKEFEAPYDAFNDAFKATTASLTGVIADIDGQIKAVEQQIVEDKRKAVQELVDEAIGKQADTPYYKALCQLSECPWFRLSKWDNVSYSLKTVQQDLDRQIGDAIQAIETCARDQTHKAELYARYKAYGSLSDLLRYAGEIAERDKAVATAIPEKQPAPEPEAPVAEQNTVPNTAQQIEQHVASNPDPNDPSCEFDPDVIHIRKPANDKQRMVCLFSAEFKCPAYAMKSIQDHLRKAGGDLKVLKYVAVAKK